MAINLPLKVAILATGKKQRRVASLARISESRLSCIVHCTSHPPTDVERRKLARVLGRDETQLFEEAVGS
jgi:transcriptional regulator with XRE-family HTH domain